MKYKTGNVFVSKNKSVANSQIIFTDRFKAATTQQFIQFQHH